MKMTMSPNRLVLPLSSSGLFIKKYPGSRVLEMISEGSNNVYNQVLLNEIKSKLDIYKTNKSISAIVIKSDNPKHFSSGLGDKNILNNKSKLLSDIDSMNVLGKYITEYNEKSENYKPIVTVNSGVFNATAYSVFANSTYNLATMSSKLVVNELANNIIPIGGFPYHLAKRTGDNDLSLALSRYMGITQCTFYYDDLYRFNLISHVVEEEPEDSLLYALAHTIADNEKKILGDEVNMDYFDELLETMHMSGDVNDIMKHSIWGKVCLVPPTAPIDEKEEEIQEKIFNEILDKIKSAFSSDDIFKIKSKLRSYNDEWSIEAADKIDTLNEKVINNYFQLTRHSCSTNATLETVQTMEKNIMINLP